MEAGEGGEPQEPEEPQEPLEPYQIMLQGFWTVSQTLSAAYGAASAEIQIIVRKSLAKTTAEDRTFVWGASGAIHQWVDSVRPDMASSEESTKDQAQLLAEARQAGKDVLDSILKLIPEEEEPKLTSVFSSGNPPSGSGFSSGPDGTPMKPCGNIHTQLADLAKEHVPEEQAGALFNTILQVTCSFQQEMDKHGHQPGLPPKPDHSQSMGFPAGDCWRGYHSLGLPAAWPAGPASLVERVTPAPQNVPGSSKTQTKSHHPPS